MLWLEKLWPVGLALIVFGIGFHLGGMGPERELAELRTDAASAQAKAEAQARAIETEWAARVAAVESNYEANRQKLDGDLRRARADSQRLRDAIASYTSSRPAESAGAACGPDDRARTLGKLLAELDELAGESSRAADEAGERLRALQAWARATD